MNRIIDYVLLVHPRHLYRVDISYDEPERSKIMDIVWRIRDEGAIAQADNEAYQIFMAAQRTKKIDGDIAEVGVSRGGSAKVICEANGGKSIHLFDTWRGSPELGTFNAPTLFGGGYAPSLEDVKKYLAGYPNVYFYKGVFPDTAADIVNKNFSFVHLDVDSDESILNCLRFFYPKMSKGGIIISHDYSHWPEFRKAIDSFFENKPEVVIELSGTQCLIVKL